MYKRKAEIMAMIASAMMSDIGKEKYSEVPTKEELERSRLNTEEKYRANMVKKGVKGFYIDGHVVYARDLKNAKRKAKNLSNGN